MIDKNILGEIISVPVPENPDDMLITEYAPLPDIVKKAEEDFSKRMQEYYRLTLNDDKLVKASRAWERAGAVLAGYAGTLFNQDAGNVELRQYALQLFDKVSKAANIRQQNLDKHCDRRMEAHKNEPETVEKYDKMGPYMKILLLIVSLNRVENCIIFIKTAVSKLTS